MTSDFALIFSLISLGFFGGFTHCIGMCGPFVLTQIGSRLDKIPLTNFSNFQRLKNLALLPYHLGRISTYSIIGFFCSFLTKNIEDFFGFKIFSAIFLLYAAAIFLNLFFDKKLLSQLKFPLKIRLPLKLKLKLKLKSKFLELEGAHRFFAKKISVLFQNPQGLKGYFLGVILGFIPCGLLYAAFLIVGTIANPIFAAIGMIFFGISTFPALFFAASGGFFLLRFEPKKLRLITKFFMLINSATLLLMAIRLVW
jgi:sulfite exporter TauE/SafE